MKNSKKKYVEPTVELLGLSAADVIQTSPVTTHWATAEYDEAWGPTASSLTY